MEEILKRLIYQPDMPNLQTVLGHHGMSNSSCGYCGSPDQNKSFMMFAGGAANLGITVHDYKAMLDRGWRRSGTLLYKPDLRNSCCQQYTIRLDATSFKTTREQRKCLNRWTKFVLGEEYIFKAARKYHITREAKKRQRTQYDLSEKIHSPEHNHLKTPPEPKHELVVNLEPNTFTEEKYQLYLHYQSKIHKESHNSRDGFKRFLCMNPFKPPYSEGPNGRKYGAFHQCYRLDGKLVAMSVIDLLPDCVSGVYFIYHEDIKHYSPGKLSAIREASLTQEGGYKYYYMGFYIHTCQKMRYKGAYSPSQILDPETYQWNTFDDEFRKRLELERYITEKSDKETKSLAPGRDQDDDKDLEDDDDDDPWGYSRTVFSTNMSGAMTKEMVDQTIDLGRMGIQLRGRTAIAQMLSNWGSTSNTGGDSTIRTMLAEVVATVGPEMSRRIVVHIA